jgi:TniQ
MSASHAAMRPLPVILPPLRDELLSSWLRRHGDFYGVTGGSILRRCVPAMPSISAVDAGLAKDDERRLADLFRCDRQDIRRMTHLRKGRRPGGLIATVKPIQICRNCTARHRTTEVTRGARLCSWMEGWRLSCPVCGTRLDDVRPVHLLNKVDPGNPLLVQVAPTANQGETFMNKVIHTPGRVSTYVVELMRILLLPCEDRPANHQSGIEIPRLLNLVVPGFDMFMRRHHRYFVRPGTLLLTMSIRIPVLAGLATIVNKPDDWPERLAGAVAPQFRDHLAACLQITAEWQASKSRASHRPLQGRQ